MEAKIVLDFFMCAAHCNKNFPSSLPSSSSRITGTLNTSQKILSSRIFWVRVIKGEEIMEKESLFYMVTIIAIFFFMQIILSLSPLIIFHNLFWHREETPWIWKYLIYHGRSTFLLCFKINKFVITILKWRVNLAK